MDNEQEKCISKDNFFKKLVIFFLMALMLISLGGCTGGSRVITVGEITTWQNVMSGEYHSFSGHYFKKVKIEKGETLTVTFSAVTEKGELIAKVIDSDGNTSKTLNTGDTVTLNQPGSYKLQVEGKKHKGNFTLSWEIE